MAWASIAPSLLKGVTYHLRKYRAGSALAHMWLSSFSSEEVQACSEGWPRHPLCLSLQRARGSFALQLRAVVFRLLFCHHLHTVAGTGSTSSFTGENRSFRAAVSSWGARMDWLWSWWLQVLPGLFPYWSSAVGCEIQGWLFALLWLEPHSVGSQSELQLLYHH